MRHHQNLARFSTALALACASLLVSAQERLEHGGRDSNRGHVGNLQLDQRYHHDHYYPARGAVVSGLPAGSVSVAHNGTNWFFHGGVWFRPYGPRYIVSIPPVGIVVPLLPPDYTALWIGGVPYYYANAVYYSAAPGQGYVVVAPPTGADVAQPVTSSATPGNVPDIIIYPRNGQSAAQIDADRQDCQRWAATQPGANSNGNVLQRALAACMDGRGYNVR